MRIPLILMHALNFRSETNNVFFIILQVRVGSQLDTLEALLQILSHTIGENYEFGHVQKLPIWITPSWRVVQWGIWML